MLQHPQALIAEIHNENEAMHFADIEAASEYAEIQSMKRMIVDHGFCNVGCNGVSDTWLMSEIIEEFQNEGLFKALSDLHRASGTMSIHAYAIKIKNAMNRMLDEALPEKAQARVEISE